jgi:flagellar motor protein MotB
MSRKQSRARTVEVIRIMAAFGMSPDALAVASPGELDPPAANQAPEHRAQNRRVELVLQPGLSELPLVDDLKTRPMP